MAWTTVSHDSGMVLLRSPPHGQQGYPGSVATTTAAPGRISPRTVPGFGWLQAFTGDPLAPDRRRKAVAVEPMTCPPNAFVTGDDLLVLQPGDTVTHTWGIQEFTK